MSKGTENLLKQAKQNENESSISSADKSFESEAEAAQVFSTLKTKILDIKEWNDHSLMSSYALFDETGREIDDKKFYTGAFIRISLKASGKYDWIQIVNISEMPDEFIITVKPTFDPTAESVDRSVISHFFTDESANNFCLTKEDKTVAFYVIGLSEKQNTSETKSALETIRNVAVNVATYLGMQKGEWEKFCRHFLEDVSEQSADAATVKK